jgi:steroid delta-isomerase-like uncharacterized protein
MSTERTRASIQRYLDSQHADLSVMADDVVFTHMATGDEHHGIEAVRGMLDYVYHQAFDARAETHNVTCDGDHAVLEGLFIGTHIGEFAGIPATGKDVRVPICVVYDLADGKIKRGRVYFEIPVLMNQLGAAG